jgi:hypothetical protein
MKHVLVMLLVTGCAATTQSEPPARVFDFLPRHLDELPAARTGHSAQRRVLSAIGSVAAELRGCVPPDLDTPVFGISLSFDPVGHVDAVEVAGGEPAASCIHGVLEMADASDTDAPAGERWLVELPLVIDTHYSGER